MSKLQHLKRKLLSKNFTQKEQRKKNTYTKPEVTVDEIETADVLTAPNGEGYEDNNTEYDSN